MLVAVRWSCQFTFRGFSLPRHRPRGNLPVDRTDGGVDRCCRSPRRSSRSVGAFDLKERGQIVQTGRGTSTLRRASEGGLGGSLWRSRGMGPVPSGREAWWIVWEPAGFWCMSLPLDGAFPERIEPSKPSCRSLEKSFHRFDRKRPGLGGSRATERARTGRSDRCGRRFARGHVEWTGGSVGARRAADSTGKEGGGKHHGEAGWAFRTAGGKRGGSGDVRIRRLVAANRDR